MSELITIHNVRGYVDHDGTAQLNLEDISRGLGFTQEKDGKEYVRWETVYRYLEEFGYKYPLDSSQLVGKANFIPENIFYRLAMKAKNETAEKFQVLVADEILPSIRKTGQYTAKPVTALEALAQTVKVLQEQESRIQQLEGTTQTIKDTIITQPDNWREDINKMFNRIVDSIGGQKFRELRAESYKLLEERARVDLQRRLVNLRGRLFEQGANKTTIEKANKLDIIEQDPKLREIYSIIIKEYTIKYVA